MSQDHCPKTTVPRLVSKTTVPRTLSQDHCPKTTVPRPLSQNHCPKTSVPRPLSQDHCPKTTVPRLLSQDYCPKTSVPRLCRTKTALVQDCPKTAPFPDCPKTALSQDCPKTVLLQDRPQTAMSQDFFGTVPRLVTKCLDSRISSSSLWGLLNRCTVYHHLSSSKNFPKIPILMAKIQILTPCIYLPLVVSGYLKPQLLRRYLVITCSFKYQQQIFTKT